MQITYPKDLRRNQLPADSEVIEVIELVCKKCKFDASRIRLNYIGGDRRKFFPRKGVKLIRACQYSVQLFVGCANETVEAHFELLDVNKRALDGNKLFGEMRKAFMDKVFYANDDIVRQRLGMNGTNHAPETVNPPAAETVQIPAPTPATAVLAVEVVEQQPSAIAEPQDDIVYAKYFDNPRNLHLVVCAIVLLCNEDIKIPFGFKQFEQVLDESNVPKSAGLSTSLIRPFLTREFVTRINPKMKPPRYCITESAIKFASGDIPASVVREKKMWQKPVMVEKSGLVPEDAFKKISLLKKTFDEHKEASSQLSVEEEKLAEMKKVNIVEETERVEGEIRNLRRRIGELEEFGRSLARKKSDIASAQAKVNLLKEQVNDPETLEKLKQLEALRRLLG